MSAQVGIQKQDPKTQRKRRSIKLYDNITSISNDAIRRLANLAGVKYISAHVYEYVRGLLHVRLEKLIKDAIIYGVEYKESKRISKEHVLFSLERNDMKYYSNGDEHNMKRCKSKEYKGYKKGRNIILNIKNAQKNNFDCYNLNRAGFERLIREVTIDYSVDSLQWSGEATGVLLHAIEMFVVKLLADANLCCIHRKSVTLRPVDIQLVFKLQDLKVDTSFFVAPKIPKKKN